MAVRIGEGVLQIDTLLGGWERVTAGYLIEGPAPVLVETAAAPEIVLVARLGAIADPAHALPKPLYLRGPDAKPQGQAGLTRR